MKKFLVLFCFVVFSTIISRAEEIYSWGLNEHYELGLGNTWSPGQVGNTSNWVQVACGRNHTVAIRDDGTLWAWGYNKYGQLGDGTNTDKYSPIQIGSGTNWSQVACGYYHTLAIRDDGTLWAWGNNGSGRLGDGTTTRRRSPVQIGSDNDWTQVGGGYSHTLGIRSNSGSNTLYAWGNNSYGQLGNGTTTGSTSPVPISSGWVQVDCGYRHTLGIRNISGIGNKLHAWGRNNSGQLGDGTTTNRISPVQIDIGSGYNCLQVACGYEHTLAIRSDNTLWAWGYNGNAQLGDGTTTNRTSPVQITSYNDWTQVACGKVVAYFFGHSVAIRDNGTLWACGLNNYGQLGFGVDGTTCWQMSPPRQIGTDTDWTQVACGGAYTLGIRSSSGNTLWAWGYRRFGQLGFGWNEFRISPVKIGSDTTWSQAAGAYRHSLAIQSNGTLWAWGNNGSGRLGDGTTTQRTSPVQIGSSATTWSQVACYTFHSLGIQSDGTLWAWGGNSHGQLGDGTTTLRTSPVQIGSSSTTWSQVACGRTHSLGIQRDGTLWAWGDNYYGQLGDGTTTRRTSPVQIGSGSDWSQVACGSSHSLAIQSDGTLWAWGDNHNGRLGDGTTTDRTIPVQIGSSSTTWSQVAGGREHTLAIRSDGTLWAWGYNWAGQLGDGSGVTRHSPVQIGNDTWSQVACGELHTSAIQSNGTLWAWGRNHAGQLGDGTTTFRLSPVQIGCDTWSQVACGYSHTLALKEGITVEISVDPEYTVEGEEPHTIYLGVGDVTCVTLNASGGSSYSWSSDPDGFSSTEQNPEVCPTETTTYTVLVTNGCTTTAEESVTIYVNDWRCGNKLDKVLVCHNGHEICISKNAVQAHLDQNHDDYVGRCRPKRGESQAIIGDSYIINIYPNPAKDLLNVEMDLLQKQDIDIRLVDMLGNELQSQSTYCPGSLQTVMDIEALPTGIYILEIKIGNELIHRKVVKE